MHLLLQLVTIVVVSRVMYTLGLLGDNVPQEANGGDEDPQHRPRRQALSIGRFTPEREIRDDDANVDDEDEVEAVGAQQGDADAPENIHEDQGQRDEERVEEGSSDDDDADDTRYIFFHY